MSVTSTKGRPIRGLDDIQRLRIVEASRSLLRLNASTDFTRTQLAAFAGVTPALISYYFPERADLIRAAVGPIVDGYRARLSHIVRSDLSRSDKLIAITCLLVESNMRDRLLIKAFYDVSIDSPGFTGSSFMRLLSPDSVDWIGASVDDERTTYYGLDFIVDSLWNVCESAAIEILSMTQPADETGLQTCIGLEIDKAGGSIDPGSQVPSDQQGTTGT